MNSLPTRVLVCGHDLKFLTPLLRRLETSDAHELRVLTHEGHFLSDHRQAKLDLDWADVIFCEWAVDNAVWFSQNKRSDQVLIVRLHLQEVQARGRIDFIYATDWSKVDRLILITHHLYDWMRREFPVLISRSALVYNPIPAASAFCLPKRPDARHVLGLVGVVPARKRLDLAVSVLRNLRAIDRRFTLRVKGALPQDYKWMSERKEEMTWYNEVFEDLASLREEGAIVFDPHGPDMATWYQSVGHILSVSDFEGSHQAVAEGMAAGCVPAIRDWEGAARMYPAHYVASTVPELAEMIQRNASPETFESESAACRRFAIARFDEVPVCDAILSIIEHEGRRINRSSSTAPLARAYARPTFLIIAYIPVGARSGYRIRVEQEVQILVQMGCIVHLACLLPPDAADAMAQQARDKHIAEFAALGSQVHLVEIEDFFRVQVDAGSYSKAVVKLIEIAELANVDVLHAEALYCARVASLVKERLPRLCFSIDWHGAVPEESRMGGAHEARVKSLETAERSMLAYAQLNIFVSEAMARHYMEKYELGALPQVIVPCCVSDQRFEASVDNVQSHFDAEALVFAYAGSMADWQCGSEMIGFFAALHRHDPCCRFLLLVPQPEHEKVLRVAQQVSLPSTAFILKAVAHEAVPAYLSTAHMGVLLRRQDTVNHVSSPTKFGEYLAAGLPVLMTDGVTDFGELVKRTGVGVVMSCATFFGAEGQEWGADLLEQITDFARHSAVERAAESRRCRTVAREELHWEPAAAKWIEMYEKLDWSN